jgi:hypothetical protein
MVATESTSEHNREQNTSDILRGTDLLFHFTIDLRVVRCVEQQCCVCPFVKIPSETY